MPEKFGRYELVERIGKGGMAEVFRARLEAAAGAEKILVIKRILPLYSSDAEFIRLFVNEAKIALPLTHGNITTTFEFGEEDGRYYLAMDYIHGRNLRHVLERARQNLAPIPVPASLFIASEIANGLAYAHGFTSTRGERTEIVHLDVSPSNVLVSYDGAVKLTDFGIARATAAADRQDERLRGKLEYSAPEHLEGKDDADARSDVFSLGCVLYAMLTGRRPLLDVAGPEAAAGFRAGAVEPPSVKVPSVADLDALVMRAIAYDPAARYATAEAFQIALAKALFERAPAYGSRDLGDWLRSTFAWELYNERPDDATDPMRDRLLFQLTKAKVVDFGADEKSTKELKARPSIEIPDAKPGEMAERPRSRARLWLAVVLVLAAVVAVGYLIRPVPPSAHPPGPPPAPIPEGFGRLSVNSWPSSTVYLDGRRLSDKTPVLDIEVKSGRHELRFSRPEFQVDKRLRVVVGAGENKTVVVRLPQ